MDQRMLSGLDDFTDLDFGMETSSFIQTKSEKQDKKPLRKLGVPHFKRRVEHTGLKGPSYKMFKREMDRRFNELYEERLRQHPMHPDNLEKLDKSNSTGGFDNSRLIVNRDASTVSLLNRDTSENNLPELAQGNVILAQSP